MEDLSKLLGIEEENKQTLELEQQTNILQSYLFTTSKYRLNLIEKRILYKIMERLQWLINKVYKDKTLKKLTIEDVRSFKAQEFIFHINEFFINTKDKERNYEKYVKALKTLRNRVIEFEIKENGKYKLYKPVGIIEQPIYENGIIRLKLSVEVLYAMLYFIKGYRKYILEVAYKLNSVYSMRIYELISKQRKNLYFNIDEFKRMLNIENKYKRVNDLKRFVLDVAKKDLDKNSPVSFEYSFQKGINSKRYETLIITPVKTNVSIEKISENNRYIKLSGGYVIDKNIIEFLKRYLNFTNKEIKANIELLSSFSFNEILAMYKYKFKYLNKSKNYKGYFISMLKNKYNELMNYVEK